MTNYPPRCKNNKHEHDRRFHQFGYPRADSWDNPERADYAEHEADTKHASEVIFPLSELALRTPVSEFPCCVRQSILRTAKRKVLNWYLPAKSCFVLRASTLAFGKNPMLQIKNRLDRPRVVRQAQTEAKSFKNGSDSYVVK